MSSVAPHFVPVYSRYRGVLKGPAMRMAEGQTLLGRDAAGGDQLFEGDTMVSRRHAEIRVSTEPWRIEICDLESKNGTFVNGRQRPSQFLVDGDLVRVGETFFVFRMLDPSQKQETLPGNRAPACTRFYAQIEQLSAHHPWVLLAGVEGTDFPPIVDKVHRQINPEGRIEVVAPSALADALNGVATVVVHDVDRLGPNGINSLLQHRGLAPVIATTTRDIEAKVNAGLFSSDLHGRFFQGGLRVPRLREQREDLPGMIVELLGEHAPPPTTDLIETLLLYAWAGDMEELMAVVSDLRVRGAGLDALVTDLVSPRLRGSLSPGNPTDDSMTQVEIRKPVPSRPDIEGLLALHDGDVEAVAEALGRSRIQVAAWLQQYGLDPEST